MTRLASAALVLGVISAGAAFAQTATTSPPVNAPAVSTPAPDPKTIQTSTANAPAVGSTSPDSKTVAAPLAGANSFTESQARSRLQAHGYTAVTELKKDDKSIWRGMAMKDGKSGEVALDYQGNIAFQ